MASLLVVIGGVLIFGLTTAFLAWGQSAGEASTTGASANYNTVGSYGLTGYPSLYIEPTSNTPEFISDAFTAGRGIVLLVYVQGAGADDEMLANFNSIQSLYADRADFYSFEAREVSESGDLLTQLGVDAPPILAVIRSDGSVYQLYTGWIGEQVMEQVIANATRL